MDEQKFQNVRLQIAGASEDAVNAARRILADPPNADAALVARIMLELHENAVAQLSAAQLILERQGGLPPRE